MARPATLQKKFPLAPSLVAAIAAIAIVAALVYISRPRPKSSDTNASPEAKAYLPNLQLSNVTMKATENFMKQQVVEVQGNIANHGSRPLRSIDVYCLFYSVDGREVYRERVPIVQTKGAPLKAGGSRAFRLPFDTLPDTWNQALPKMVIAQIRFAQ